MEDNIPALIGRSPLNFQTRLDRAFDWFVSAYIFVTIFLPSGSIYGINFKSPLYVGLLPLALYSFFKRRHATPARIALSIGAPVLLFCWVVLGLWDGFDLASAMRQYADILLTLLMCWLVFLFCENDELRRIRFLRVVLNAVLAASVLKLGLIVYALVEGIPVVVMVALMSKIFNADLITLDLGSLYGRVQFISDELIPICLFILLRHRDRLKIGEVRATISILLLIISVAFSFSRYFWAFAGFALVLGLLLGKRDRFQAAFAAAMGVAVVASLPALQALYQLRFSAGVAGESDLLRAEQIPALQRFFLEAPFLGHGLGSYTVQVVRGMTVVGRYAYEVQLLALPAQIGLIGMALLVALVAFYYQKLWWKSPLNMPDRIGIALLLAFWIAAGFANPLLFHPVAGVNYAALATLASMASKRTGNGSMLRIKT